MQSSPEVQASGTTDQPSADTSPAQDFRQLAFFRREVGERTFSRREFAAQLYPDTQAFIELLKLPKEYHDAARVIVHREGHEAAFFKMALASMLGLTTTRISDYFNRYFAFGRNINYEIFDHLHSKLANGHFAKIRPEQANQVLRHPEREKNRVKLIQASYRAFPASLARVMTGMREGATVLGMYLPEREMQQVLADSTYSGADHTHSAFAYLRYYQQDQNFIVAEVQCDWYGRLKSGALKRRYKHWAENLVLAFEDQVIRLCDNPVMDTVGRLYRKKLAAAGIEIEQANLHSLFIEPDESTRELADRVSAIMSEAREEVAAGCSIYFPTSALIGERWPDLPVDADHPNAVERHSEDGTTWVLPGIAPQLAKHVYDALPLKLDYSEAVEALPLFPERDSENRKLTDAPCRVKKLSIADLDEAGYNSQFERALEVIDPWEFGWLERHREIFPAEFFSRIEAVGIPSEQSVPRGIVVGGVDVASQLSDEFELVPIDRISPEQISGTTSALRSYHLERVKGGDFRPALELLSRDFSFVSKDALAPLPNDWTAMPMEGNSGWHLVPFHHVRAHRTPSLRFVHCDEQGKPDHMFAVRFHGGGLRDLENAPVSRYSDHEHDRFPIYSRSAKDAQEMNRYKDGYWGAHTLQGAERLYANALGVSYLLHSIDPALANGVAFPLDVGSYSSLPVWREGRTDWYPHYEYLRHVKGEWEPADPTLSCMRAVVPCDVSIGDLFTRVFSQEGAEPEEMQQELCKMIQFAYWLHGEQFIQPDGAEVPSDSSHEQILGYLHQIYSVNQVAADRIIERISNQLASAAGILHGAGGHLAPMSGNDGDLLIGSFAMFNVDLTGSVSTVRAGAYLPQFQLDLSIRARYLQEGSLGTQQWLDSVLLNNTLDWVDALFRGRQKGEVAEVRKIEMDNFGAMCCLGMPDETALHSPQPGATPDEILETIVKRLGNAAYRERYQVMVHRARQELGEN